MKGSLVLYSAISWPQYPVEHLGCAHTKYLRTSFDVTSYGQPFAAGILESILETDFEL